MAGRLLPEPPFRLHVRQCDQHPAAPTAAGGGGGGHCGAAQSHPARPLPEPVAYVHTHRHPLWRCVCVGGGGVLGIHVHVRNTPRVIEFLFPTAIIVAHVVLL